jgi:protein-L-isoaspartate O-methyltransferase
VEGSLLPWVLDGVELGTSVLEIGPGLTTDVLRHRAASLTAVELDPALAAGLGRRLGGSGVRVIQGDGAALPFRDSQFDAVVVLPPGRHPWWWSTPPGSPAACAEPASATCR